MVLSANGVDEEEAVDTDDDDDDDDDENEDEDDESETEDGIELKEDVDVAWCVAEFNTPPVF